MAAENKLWILHETVSQTEATAVATHLGALTVQKDGFYRVVSEDRNLFQRAKDFAAGYQAALDQIQKALDRTWDRAKTPNS